MPSDAPDSVWIAAVVEYSSPDLLMEGMNKFKEFETLDDLDNQVVDLDGEDPVIGYYNSNESGTLYGMTLNTDFSDEGELDDEEETSDASEEMDKLRLVMQFDYDDIQIMFDTIRESVGLVNELSLHMMGIIFHVDTLFEDLSQIDEMSNVTDYNLSSVSFDEEGFVIQVSERANTDEEMSNFDARSSESETIDSSNANSFITERVDRIVPIVEEITNGKPSNSS